MNRTRQILKKSAAAVLCASLILSGSSTAFAAGSYQETSVPPISAPIRARPVSSTLSVMLLLLPAADFL